MSGGQNPGSPSVGRASDLTGLTLAAALSLYAVLLTNGTVRTGYPHGGVAASIGVLAMTLPVLWARRVPLLAAGSLGIAAPLNVLAFGSIVRCGAALPAVFYVVACLGVPRWSWRALLGVFFAVGSLASQAVYDPKLKTGTLPLLIVVAAAFYASGRLIGQRIEAVAVLRRHNAELIETRNRTAALSIAIERERVAGQLDLTLGQELDRIETVAIKGRALLSAMDDTGLGSTDARAGFADIEGSARQALALLRGVLSGLRHERRDDRLSL